MKKWKTISTRIIFEHPRIKIFEDKVELPNGKIIEYLKFDNDATGVTVISRDNSGKFLLQKEYSYPPDEIMWQFPGGGVKENEKIDEGANRELMEEAKLRANKLELLGFYYVNNRRSNHKMWVFLATGLTSEEVEEDEEEFIESFWFEEKKIDELVKKNEIKNVYLLAAWALYKGKK